jgi:hypothetical protein
MKRNRSIVKLAFERDGGRCRNCNEPATAAHHVIPLVFGGTDALSNLICLCDACHYAAHRGMAVTQVKSTHEPTAQGQSSSSDFHAVNANNRDRQGRQLAFEIDPQLLQKLREYAADNRTTIAGTVRQFIADGLQNAELQEGDSLDGRLAWLESQVFRLIASTGSETYAEEVA